MKKLERKNRGAQKKRSSYKVRGVSPEAGGPSLWWERFVKEIGFESHHNSLFLSFSTQNLSR